MCGTLKSPSSNFCTWGFVCFLCSTCHFTVPFPQGGKLYQTGSKAQAPQPALVGLLRLSCFKIQISSGVTAHCPWLLVDGQYVLQHPQLGLVLTIHVKQIGPEPLFIPRKNKEKWWRSAGLLRCPKCLAPTPPFHRTGAAHLERKANQSSAFEGRNTVNPPHKKLWVHPVLRKGGPQFPLWAGEEAVSAGGLGLGGCGWQQAAVSL